MWLLRCAARFCTLGSGVGFCEKYSFGHGTIFPWGDKPNSPDPHLPIGMEMSLDWSAPQKYVLFSVGMVDRKNSGQNQSSPIGTST
jgi:hypothetical protein